MKSNKVLVVLVIILGLLVIGLGGYIVYDKVLSSNNNSERGENKITEEENNSEKLILESYLGTWYESKEHFDDQNANNLNIRNINNNQMTFNLYITRTAQFDDVNVIINNNYGTFEAITDNGPSSDGNISKITGRLELFDNEIKLYIEHSNVLYLDSNTEYTFTYKN